MKAPQSPWPLRTAAGRTIAYYSVQIPDPLERLRFLRKCMEVTGEYIPLAQRRPFCVWLYRNLFLTTVAEGSRISSPARGCREGRLLELLLRRNHLPRRVAGGLAFLCLVIWFLVGVALTCRQGASATLEAARARTEERGLARCVRGALAGGTTARSRRSAEGSAVGEAREVSDP